MGVKECWEYLKRRCQRAKVPKLPPVDGLFIDIARFTYDRSRANPVTSEGYYPPEFYDGVIADIKDTVSWVQPGRVVYIGKDGPEPTAKLGEIKERLRGTAKPPSSIEVIKPTGPHSRDQNICNRILQLKKEDPYWCRLEVIYDPRSSPGEAEVKFLQYLRNDESARQMSWCVYSGDTDFIPALLALHRRNLWFSFNRKSIYRIEVIHWYVASLFDGSNESVDDFIAFMSLLGNDFLPGIAVTDKVISAYQRLFLTGITGHLVVNGDIDSKVLKALLRKLEQDAQKGAQVSQTKKAGANPKREEAMADAYLHGIRWFTHLYLGGLCDWYWSYIFSERPQIGMMLNRIDAIDMCRDSIPKESFDPSWLMDIHIAGHLPLERTEEVYHRLVGNSMDEIYSSEPERFSKVTRSLESARVIAKELGEERIEIAPGRLWISRRNERSFREVDISWEPRFPSDVKDNSH